VEHKLIQGGEVWLPFARSRVKALKATGLLHASQQFVMPDGATVHVRISPGADYISLAAVLQEGYQFFTTGPTVQKQGSAYLGHSLRVRAVPDKANPGAYKLKAKAIASTLQADTPAPGEPPRWRFEPLAQEISGAFPRKYVWQQQGVTEHQYFAKDATGEHPAGVAPNPMMVDSWSQASPIGSLGVRGSTLQVPSSTVDIEYDVAPSLFRKNAGAPSAGPYADAPSVKLLGAAAPDADWYKRAAFVKLTHAEHGARTFCVLADVSNQFHVYPAGADLSRALLQQSELLWPAHAASIKTAIPDNVVQRAEAPLPAWCRTDPEEARVTFERATLEGNAEWVNDYLVRKPQYRWAFNSDCTKACAVVFEDIAGIPRAPDNSTPERGDGGEVKESLPGLVELGLHIAITGPNPQDFTFSLTLDRELRATVTKQYVMAADYAWVVKDGETAITALDDLILLTGAIYHTSSERQTTPSAANVDLDLNALKGVVTVRNHTQARDIRAFLVSDTNLPYAGVRADPAEFTPQMRWALPYFEARGVLIAYDLRILAFVVQQRLIVQDLTGGTTPGMDDRRQGVYKAVQRVLVYAHNALVQTKTMDPASPLNAQLATVFANTDATGLFRFPVDDVGEYRRGTIAGEGTPGEADHLHTAYRSLDLMRARFDSRFKALYWYGPLNVDFFFNGGSVNAGPFLYFNKIANVLRTGSQDAFSIHPDGSWAIATAPIYYYGGAGTDLASKYPFHYSGSDSMAEQIDPALMKQAMVDIISIRVTDKDGAFQDVRGTHLAAINEAFGLAWTEQDFMCAFALHEEVDDVPIVPVVHRYLIASTQTPGADDVFLVYRNWSHLEGTDVVGAGNPVYLDPRATDYDHEYAFSGPVLRGASLFY
jgi:hypothetical protein